MSLRAWIFVYFRPANVEHGQIISHTRA